MICIDPKSTEPFVFPPKDMREECMEKGLYLAGFESAQKHGENNCFNFVLSNGSRSNYFKNESMKFTHLIPKDLINKIRAVTLHHYHDSIYGFSFSDKDGEVIWKHGWTTWSE